MVFADGCETMSVNGTRDGRPLLFARDDAEARRIYYYILWPNLIVSVHPDYVLTHQAFPDGPNRSTVYCDLYVEADKVAPLTSPVRSSSGTSRTARTITSSSCNSRGRARVPGRLGATRTRRRRSTRSTSWSRTVTRTTAPAPSAAGVPRPRRIAGSSPAGSARRNRPKPPRPPPHTLPKRRLTCWPTAPPDPALQPGPARTDENSPTASRTRSSGVAHTADSAVASIDDPQQSHWQR